LDDEIIFLNHQKYILFLRKNIYTYLTQFFKKYKHPPKINMSPKKI